MSFTEQEARQPGNGRKAAPAHHPSRFKNAPPLHQDLAFDQGIRLGVVSRDNFMLIYCKGARCLSGLRCKGVSNPRAAPTIAVNARRASP